jgi:mRNA interferase MazF
MTTTPAEDDIPRAGDLAWVDFDPRVGREQSGRRPALILTPYGYHAKTPYMIVCPITSNTRPYSFKVLLPDDLPIKGAVLVDQIKSVDPWARGCDVVGRAPESVMADVRGLLASLLQIQGPQSQAGEMR